MYNSFTMQADVGRVIVPVPEGNGQDQANFGIQNPTGSAGSVWIGGPGVTTSGSSKGWEIATGQSFSGSLISANGAPYIIANAPVVVTILTNG